MKFNFSDINVLLIGDFMIDHYIMGTSNRLSPEAPVPVVIPQKEYSIPGGAGNVAMNLSAMGANVKCLGVVGNDIWGKKLLSILKNEGIDVDDIDVVKGHLTTLKKRIYSNGKQVARIDTEKIIDNFLLSDFNLSTHLKEKDVCILSDYNKGVIQNADLDYNNQILNKNIFIVDPKKNDFSFYEKANIVTPNLNELQKATNIEIQDSQSIITACTELIKKHDFNYIVAKRGADGMTIVGKDNFIKHIEAHSVKNPDVTGAGDTVIAALSIAYAKTQDIELSAHFANNAAATVVGKPGTATASVQEIEKLSL
jgi:rfaE bifunctional protein kinase chain/domain